MFDTWIAGYKMYQGIRNHVYVFKLAKLKFDRKKLKRNSSGHQRCIKPIFFFHDIEAVKYLLKIFVCHHRDV